MSPVTKTILIMESCFARHKMSLLYSSLARLSIYDVSNLTDAIMRTISVSTITIRITNMTIIVAFINIYEHNRFVNCNWKEKKILASLLDNKAIICNEQVFCFFSKSNLIVPWHDPPFPVYPSLQVQIWEPLVLVQFAFMSQSWLSSLHSSISRSIKGDVIECTRVVCENRPLKCGLISVGESLCAKLLVLKYCRLLLLTLAWLSIPSVSFLTSAVVRAVSVGTICGHVTSMASIEALIDI